MTTFARTALPGDEAAVAERVIAKIPETSEHVEAYAAERLDIENTLNDRMALLDTDSYENLLRPAFKDDEWIVVALGATLGFAVRRASVADHHPRRVIRTHRWHPVGASTASYVDREAVAQSPARDVRDVIWNAAQARLRSQSSCSVVEQDVSGRSEGSERVPDRGACTFQQVRLLVHQLSELAEGL